MPVYAEQKEPTTFDRVVEPSLDTEIANSMRVKEEQVIDNDDSLTTDSSSSSSSSSPSSSSTTPINNNNNNDNDDSNMVTSDKNDTDSLVVEVSSTEEHIIIFDWDDTLLASSFLASQGYRLDADMEKKENYEFVKNELKMLENCVTTLLDEALQRGKVHIITNAETGWVELSAQKFLPSVVPYLSKITVISARSTYEPQFPDSPVKWKYMAMYDRLSFVMNSSCRKNVISFGDSHVEREAVRSVTRILSNTRTKSIKFAECPNTEQLRKQLELVASCFHYIFTHDGDLDLMLKMSMVPAPSAPSPSPSEADSSAPITA